MSAVYRLNFRTNDGPNWSKKVVTARNFYHAYGKAQVVADRDTAAIHKASARGKKEDRVSKSFRIDVESIEVVCELG